MIFARLSRKPVEWYWRGATAQRFSFPAEIDTHPGYEGAPGEEALREEARQLAGRLKGRVFVLADPSRAASRILLEELRAKGQENSPPCLACEQPGKHYLSQMLRFEFRR